MELLNKKCKPLKNGDPPLTKQEEDTYVKEVPSWELETNGTHKIHKDYKFGNFKQAIQFVNRVADIAEEEGHHPDLTINYNVVKADLSTHSIGGLSENDFIMAAKMDQAY